MEARQIENIVHAGVILAVYSFIMIALYFFLSAPIDAIMTGITGAPLGEAADEMVAYSPGLNWAIKAAFACGIATPATWFIFWVFSKEPFIGYKRRY